MDKTPDQLRHAALVLMARALMEGALPERALLEKPGAQANSTALRSLAETFAALATDLERAKPGEKAHA